ncbi:DNA glycosylase [Paraphaeosphaeria sporulosa]|uniref:DNA glycosylase n=1 Tax=Paraphaeosphaeria sporulosa TaxID=1460663 RepID=A0A177CI56_9PLEO|nr:DNA glycosylase [Paraphaeosphaeria sporulosa]OAG06996.1 DNA glycosylase [Paraphaeosphaeria sporulosa]
MKRVTRGSAAKEHTAQSPAIATEHDAQLSSVPATPDKLPVKTSKPVSTRKKTSVSKALPITPNSTRKRSRGPIKDEEDINELPHNLGKIPQLSHSNETLDSEPASKKPRKSAPKKTVAPKKESAQDVVDKATGIADSPTKESKKNNNYGVVPGTTPYPDWPHPTHEECEQVNRLLSSAHGEVKAPEVVPPPSLEVTGCGEVPSVLDALIRTLLSAATSGANSRRAFQGLVKQFGILEEGIGKGSVDWNKVRLASQKEVFEAIKSGGLADSKSKYMKGILQMVWEENQNRKAKLAASSDSIPGSKNELQEEMDEEISKAENDILSLDHYHLLSTDEAFKELTKFPGIGAKTASCVTLLCLQRPSFAVDTHVFRLCQWLGWVPPPGHPALLPPGKKGKPGQPTRDRTYAHCEVRIPDHLKYPLHQLFIKHGKTCPRCRANTSETYGDWKKGCVIDHLVKRTGVRKGGDAIPGKTTEGMKARRQAKQKVWEHENESESSDLSDLGSDDEEASLLAEEDEDLE